MIRPKYYPLLGLQVGTETTFGSKTRLNLRVPLAVRLQRFVEQWIEFDRYADRLNPYSLAGRLPHAMCYFRQSLAETPTFSGGYSICLSCDVNFEQHILVAIFRSTSYQEFLGLQHIKTVGLQKIGDVASTVFEDRYTPGSRCL